MSFRRWLLLAPVLVACKGGGDLAEAPAPVDGGAVTPPAGGVELRVHTPIHAGGTGSNATWAAALDAAGQWARLEPAGTDGRYVITPAGDRWTVAFVCADGDKSLVAVYERARTVTTLDVELESQCDPEGTDYFDLTGTFTHFPPATTWLDFGYALDGRGFVMPPQGEGAPYELINVVAGTWDLGFGLRDEGGGPLTKLFIVRNQAITGPTKIDFDVAAVGLDPVLKKLVVNGIGAEDNFEIVGQYAFGGGQSGIDIGPHDVGPERPSVTTDYVTFPPRVTQPTDRHLLHVRSADGDRETADSWRDADLAFQVAIDATADLPDGLPPPRAETTSPAPYPRITTFVATRPSAAFYETRVVAKVSNRVSQAWRVSVDAARATGPEVDLALPDLSGAAGWNPEWALRAGTRVEVTATVREAPTPLGDGTATRSASRRIMMP